MSSEEPKDPNSELKREIESDFYKCAIGGDEIDVDIGSGVAGGGRSMKIMKKDPGAPKYSCLKVDEVKKLLKEVVEGLSTQINVTPSEAKMLLHKFSWSPVDIFESYKMDAVGTLIAARIEPEPDRNVPVECCSSTVVKIECPSCSGDQPIDSELKSLACGHQFCNECWTKHFESQINDGVDGVSTATAIGCMAHDCPILAPEDFVLALLTTEPNTREEYEKSTFRASVQSHPGLRFCVGPNCDIIVHSHSKENQQLIICGQCNSCYCFKCGSDYHAPADCEIMQRWFEKCAVDDGETAKYLIAHTKDCPNCGICIERDGWYDHILCGNCNHGFCWECFGEWKKDDDGEPEHHKCKKFQECQGNSNIAAAAVAASDLVQPPSATALDREALKKYIYYYEKWQNHSMSANLEEETLERVKDIIQDKMTCSGTWIDWEYLIDAAKLVTSCRRTLQYTYPHAYFMEAGPEKELFEYQQAQLEEEIGNLSWKIKRSDETTDADRCDLQNQMHVAEKRRSILVKGFSEP